MEQNRALTFEDYVSRRIQPVKVLVSMLSKELKLAKEDEISFTREELEDVISTIDIFIEEFALASKQKKVSRRSKAAEMNAAYPSDKHPLSQVA